MSQKSLIAEVIEELEKAILVAKKMEETGKQPAVEVAILLEKLRHCYEMLLFPESNSNKETDVKRHEEKSEPTKPLKTEESIKTETIHTPEIAKLVESAIPIIVQVDEPVVKPIEKQVEEPKSVIIDKTAKIVKKHETLGEKHLAGKRFLKDYLADNISKEDLSTRQQKMPIADLNKAFRVIDTFMFTRELFKNDNLLFQNTIQTLNEMESLEDALMHIGANFDWKADEPTVVKFIEILQRRFM